MWFSAILCSYRKISNFCFPCDGQADLNNTINSRIKNIISKYKNEICATKIKNAWSWIRYVPSVSRDKCTGCNTSADQHHNYQSEKQHPEPNAEIVQKNFPIASHPQIHQPEVTPVFISQNNSRQEERENNVRLHYVIRTTVTSECCSAVIPTPWQSWGMARGACDSRVLAVCCCHEAALTCGAAAACPC